MKRRDFLRTAGAGLAASTLAAPAIAQTMPQLKWRLTATWPKSLDTLYGSCEDFAKRVAEITENNFQIQVFAGGEIVPGLQVLDAVQNGTVEMGHTAGYYYWGKDPSFGFATAVPFGLNARQQNAWLLRGEGGELLDGLFADFGCYGIPMGNTGAQMGGWFRKEIKSVDDMKGLKFRIGGFAGSVIQRLGVVPQQLAPGDIYPALEKGTLDASEWIGPYDDEKLGFYKVAKYYYYPGWWEGAATGHLFINRNKWNSLSKSYQAIVTAAAQDAAVRATAKYDVLNAPALKRLIANGTQLRPFSPAIMDASYKAAIATYDEIGKKNARFKKIHDSMMGFRDTSYSWWQVCELTFDAFQVKMLGRS